MTKSACKYTLPRLGRREIATLIGSGAFALFVSLVVSAFQIAGVINMVLAHVLIGTAWLVAVVAVYASETLSPRPRKHKIIVVSSMALVTAMVLFGIDRWMVRMVEHKAAQEFAAIPSVEREISPLIPTPVMPEESSGKEGALLLKLTPHVVVQRIYGKGDIPATAFYSFSVVLYAHNTMVIPKNVRQLEITGDVPLEFNDFLGGAKEGSTINELEAEYLRRQPYYTISLVSYPKGAGRIEPHGDERFIQFDFMEPLSLGARIYNDEKEDYIGYRDTQTAPKKLTTQPNLQDLVKFARREEGNFQEWRSPTLREEITAGKVRFVALVDSDRIELKADSVNRVQSTPQKTWNEGNPADLYFLGVYGGSIDRGALRGDPATRRR